MSFAELRLFKEIAQTRSVTKGAEHCGISQSAASQHLHEVELRLGVPLLDRSTRPLVLTPAGKLYFDLCRDVLEREEQFTLKLEKLKREVEGTVRVASIYSVGISEMSGVRAAFAERFPKAQLVVEYMRPDRVYQAVLGGDADLGIVSYPGSSREMAVIPWREEAMVVAASPGHPLSERPALEPGDLDGQDFVGFDVDLPIRREQDRFFRERGVTVRIAMQFDNIQMIKEAVALGSGVSILPARTMQADIYQGRLVSIPLDAPGLVRPLGIIHRRKKKFTRAMESLLALLQEGSLRSPGTGVGGRGTGV